MPARSRFDSDPAAMERKSAAKTMTPRRARQPSWAAAASKLTGATEATLRPAAIAPALATHADRVPAGDEWVHEVKFDGYRMLTTVVAGRAHLWSRNGVSWTARLPSIAAALESLGPTFIAVDGELIAGGGRREDFGLLQATLAGREKGALRYVIFDLLHLDGVGLEAVPLRERKALLSKLLAVMPDELALSTHAEGEGAKLAMKLASVGGYEGVVSKRATSQYTRDRTTDWLKIKDVPTEDLAVVGYTREAGARRGFSSLLLARPTSSGWVYAGRVGSGFSEAQKRALMSQLDAGGSMPTVSGDTTRASLRNATWFEPRFVVEVANRGTGRSGLVRQASFKRTRPDRDVNDLA